jgi:hypothetical protein
MFPVPANPAAQATARAFRPGSSRVRAQGPSSVLIHTDQRGVSVRNIMLKAAAGLLVGASALLAPAAAATAAVPAAQHGSIHPKAGCGSVFDNVDVDGGEAAWSIDCGGNTITISGWVRDTDADGKCAYIKAFASNGESRVPLATACRKGTTTRFSWSVNNANDIRAYLFTA